MGLNRHFHGKPKNVKIIFLPVTVFPAQTGLQTCDLRIIQQGKDAQLCWIILKSQVCKPVWAGKTVTGKNIIFTFLGSPWKCLLKPILTDDI